MTGPVHPSWIARTPPSSSNRVSIAQRLMLRVTRSVCVPSFSSSSRSSGRAVTVTRYAVARATGWTVRDFAAAPAALKEGIREASPPGLDAPVPSQAEAPPPPPEVSGFKIEEKIASVARATTPLEAWPYVLMALLVAAGVLLESRKRAFDR